MLESGFILEYPKEFTLQVHAVLSSNLNLGKDIQVEEEHEAEEDDNRTLVQDEEEEDQMDSHTVENNPVFYTYVTYIDFTFTVAFYNKLSTACCKVILKPHKNSKCISVVVNLPSYVIQEHDLNMQNIT